MGCQNTKVGHSKDVPNGKSNGGPAAGAAENGVLPDPAAPAPTDPRLPLDARQVFRIKKSWKAIKRNMQATGVEIFIQ